MTWLPRVWCYQGVLISQSEAGMRPLTNEGPGLRGSSVSVVTRLLIDRIPGDIGTRWSVTSQWSEIWSQDWHRPDIQHSGQWHTVCYQGRVTHVTWHVLSDTWAWTSYSEAVYGLSDDQGSYIAPGYCSSKFINHLGILNIHSFDCWFYLWTVNWVCQINHLFSLLHI